MTVPAPATHSVAPGSRARFERARAVIPGGVDSPVRAFGAVGGTPRFVAEAHGAHLTDVDGTDYVDLVGSWGPMILGHADPAVLAAVTEAAARGFSYGLASEPEVALAEEIVARMPPVDEVRLVNSGTEATMSAIRLARGATGRARIVKFAGCYHGHSDSLLVDAGSGVATFGLPGTPGVTPGTAADTIVVPYNDEAAVTRAFEAAGDDIAALITEACPGNMGIVPPRPGFTEFLRRTTRAHGALLISDEVMTGFRVSAQGWYGHEGPYAAGPADLYTFGKVVGGGFPVAAFGGRRDLMAQLAPVGPVYQAGTLSGNPVATSAGLATLRGCTPEVYRHLDEFAAALRAEVHGALEHAGVPHVVQNAASMFSVFLLDPADPRTERILAADPAGEVRGVRDFDDARAQHPAAFAAFFNTLLDRGVHIAPSGYEVWFVSAAHGDAELERVAAALPAAAAAAAAAY